MYNSRIGFPRRMNSVNLSRHGSTQYIRPINHVTVPPYTITNTQVDEAVRIISSNHGSAVIDNSFRSRRTPVYLDIGSVQARSTTIQPVSRQRSHPNRSQNNINLVQLEFDPSDPAYVTTNVPYSQNNVIGIHEVSNTTYSNNGYRQGIDLSIISNNIWYGETMIQDEETGNMHYENTAWQTSMHFIVTTSEDSYSGNTQPAIKLLTYIDNDNSQRYIRFKNEGATDLIIMQVNKNNENPATIPNFHEGDEVPDATPLPWTIDTSSYIILTPGEQIFFTLGFDMLSQHVQIDEHSYGSFNLSTSVCTLGIDHSGDDIIISNFEPDSLGFNPNPGSTSPLPDISTSYKLSYAYAKLDQNSNAF